MGLSLREKQLFYDQLGQLLRAGLPVGTAIDKLARTSRGSLSSFLRSLRRGLDRGATLGDAFHQARPALSEMEQATLAGLARSGQMEAGLKQLSGYFGALHTARAEVTRRLLYPLFLLHFGVLCMKAPLIFTRGFPDYLRASLEVLAVFYGLLVVAAILVPFLVDAGSFIGVVDAGLRAVPFLGKIRRAFAVSRFCATYNMQLDAGVNVMDSLRAAGQASRSGLIRGAVRRALPEVRRGEQAGEQLARSSSAFPSEMLSAFVVAEETGRLDQTLRRLAEEYQAEAFRRIQSASEWIPRLIYVAILVYLGWQVVRGYQGYLRQIDTLMEPL